LLNLISNGFYAATKRKAEATDGAYEPTITAATRNLGESVEVRIRDNGIGTPPDVREKMFNPFFTTKPTGEGTGLGLSISHDIVVKQHSGSIEVETEPGAFTEIKIILPRAAASATGATANPFKLAVTPSFEPSTQLGDDGLDRSAIKEESSNWLTTTANEHRGHLCADSAKTDV
jgi:hypothetical protein